VEASAAFAVMSGRPGRSGVRFTIRSFAASRLMAFRKRPADRVDGGHIRIPAATERMEFRCPPVSTH
jgi:hypothetical protein